MMEAQRGVGAFKVCSDRPKNGHDGAALGYEKC